MTARATFDGAEHARAARKAGGMTVLGTILSFFPALVTVLALTCGAWFAVRPTWAPLASLVAVVYLLPVAAYRLHGVFFPLREGGSALVGTGYSPWYGGHQLQVVYLAFPALERTLRLVPGLYSAWLRLWGSRVGRGVYWTPQVEIIDRGLVDIGDGVVLGHRCGMSSHLIRPARGNLRLYVRRVRIGAGAFVGAGAYLAPGVVIEPGTLVPAGSHVLPRTLKGAA
jgi:acetyltransferase-like isoleucine patch superfamily enzyme